METHFSRNMRDVSRGPHDVDAGFQFDFYCERCRDTWRSPFEAYRRGQVAGWLTRAASMLGGGIANDAGRAATGIADAAWGEARDTAMQTAIVQAEQHFHRCAKCQNQVCPKCWNVEKGLCLDCAPDLQAEVEAARSSALVAQARENAQEVGKAQAAQVDVKRDSTNACPRCKAMTYGSKFCPECGFDLAGARIACGGCKAMMPAGTRFCTECGKPIGGASG